MKELNLRAVICVLVSLYLVLCDGKSKAKKTPGRVLLVSFDGLRHDYARAKESVVLKKMAAKGVAVDYVHNVFPTNTNPNHHSIITGLYPENHGIIDNVMYNETDGSFFKIDKNATPWFQEAEPLWNTNQKEGYKSGSCYYPASNLEIQGMRPAYSCDFKNFTMPYVNKSKTMSFRRRIDEVVSWFRKDNNVTFAALYFEQPDETAHDIAPLGALEKDKHTWKIALQLVNKALEYLLMKLEAEGLNETINVIVTGDHGSVMTKKGNIIKLDECLGNAKKYLKTAIGFTFVSVYPKEGYFPFVYNRLLDCNPNVTVFLKDQIPESLHIRNSHRTAPIILLVAPSFIVDNGIFPLEYQMDFPRGEHGYSNFVREMNPAFVAMGPAFKKAYRQASIDIVDIYQLICHIIGIYPGENDGNISRVGNLLKKFY